VLKKNNTVPTAMQGLAQRAERCGVPITP